MAALACFYSSVDGRAAVGWLRVFAGRLLGCWLVVHRMNGQQPPATMSNNRWRC